MMLLWVVLGPIFTYLTQQYFGTDNLYWTFAGYCMGFVACENIEEPNKKVLSFVALLSSTILAAGVAIYFEPQFGFVGS
ncbi:hypothetical protein [Neptuniibacter sp. QD37_11]|uniref:hypothetical protein n=1 Tax=Neptuniibacter sp. QD37_11 TaxID=3398209 RepID=UPI0039F5AE32